MADTSNLTTFLGDVADAIREKRGTELPIPAANFDTEIRNIQTGIDTSDATATADDIIYPKTAYVNGQKLTGNIIPTYKTLDVSEYHDSTPDWQKNYTMYDMINVQDYTIVMGLNGGIFYFTVLKNNTEYVTEFQLPLSGNFNGTNIYSCAIQLESMSDNQMNFVIGVSWDGDNNVQFKRMRYDIDAKTFEVYNDCTASLGYTGFKTNINRIIRDANTPNVFYMYCPDRSVSATYARLGILKITWTETSGSINWVKTKRMNSVEGPWTSYPFQQIGDGDVIVVGKNVVSVDILAMTMQVESSEPFFISHNLKYMIYNNAFYKITDTTSVKNMFSKKVFVSELGVTSSGIISFSEDDTYIIVPTSQTLYIFKIEDDNIARVQNFPITFTESKPSYNAYNFLVKDNTSDTYHLLYCDKNQQALVAMKRDEQDYFSTYDATAIESEILYGKTAYGQTGKIQGSMPNNGELNYEVSTSEQTIPAGYTSGGTIEAARQTNEDYDSCLEITNYILTGGVRYQPLEYVQSNMNQYLDTGISLFNYDTWEIEMEIMLSSLYNYQHLVSVLPNNEDYEFWIYDSGQFSFRYADYTKINTNITLQANIKYILKLVYNGSQILVYLNNEEKASYNRSGKISNALKFGHSEGDTSYFSGNLYSLIFKGNNNIILNGTPAKDMATGEIGLFDTITNTFFTSAGTLNYVAGPTLGGEE